MAGRPRAMLKRIHSWMKRVGELHDEIIAHMPDQYKNPHPAEGDLTADPRPDKRNWVACQWTACDKTGIDLYEALVYLESAIAERTGVSVPFDDIGDAAEDTNGLEAPPEAVESPGS